MLVDSGVAVHPAALVPRIWLPGRHGSLQAEIVAASREFERLPYLLPPEFPALLDEVAAGRPVLVLQNLGVSLAPAWHYAVVVGYSRTAGEVVLRSGTERRRVVPARLFARTWRRGGNWALVLLRPGQLPVNPDRRRYLEAAAAAESAGRAALAAAAWDAASRRWPDEHIAWLGRGNAAYGRGELERAERMYRRALALSPGNPAALHNLIVTVAESGRCEEAVALLDAARPGDGNELPDQALAATDCR